MALVVRSAHLHRALSRVDDLGVERLFLPARHA
jgi:hypothetical protein